MMDDAMAAEVGTVPECKETHSATPFPTDYPMRCYECRRAFLIHYSENDGFILRTCPVCDGTIYWDAELEISSAGAGSKSNPLYETQLRMIGKLKAAIGSDDGKREGEPVDVALERIIDETCGHVDIVRKMERELIDKLKTTFEVPDGRYFGRGEEVLAKVVDAVCATACGLKDFHRECADKLIEAFGLNFETQPYSPRAAVLQSAIALACSRYAEAKQPHDQKWKSQLDARVKESHAELDVSGWQNPFGNVTPPTVLSVESDYAATVKVLSEAIQVLAKEQKQTYASCNKLSNTLADVVKQRMNLEELRAK